MKTTILARPRGASQPASSGLWASGAALTAALLLLATASLSAGVKNGVAVGTVCGGGYPPFYGSVEGDPITSTDAQFYNPIGLALDSTGEYLFVADRDNNKIRAVDLASSPDYYYSTYTFAPIAGFTDGTINNPVGVALDANDNVYVLNRGNGNNGTVVVFDSWGNPLGTNSVPLINANALTLDSTDNAYVTASNKLFRITFSSDFTTSSTTSVTNVTSAGANLQGLVVMDSGMIAACDSGRNGIYLINPTNGAISNLTGFNGAGDNNNIWTNTPNHPVTKATAMFNQPMGLAKAGNGMLIVADYGNNRVKAVDSVGTVTNLYGVSSSLWYFGGWHDGSVVVPDAVGDVEARLPNGVLFAADGTVYVTEDYYHLIRQVTGNFPPLPPPPPTILTISTNSGQIILTWSASPGATSYNVKRSTSSGGPYTTIANVSSTTYTDTSAVNGTTNYYVVSAVGAAGESGNSAPVGATLPLLQVPDPQIGYVDFSGLSNTSVFTAVSSFVANNDVTIVIEGTDGSLTFYTSGFTGGTIPDPTSSSPQVKRDSGGYQDGLSPSEVANYAVFQTPPYGCYGDLTIKAIGEKPDGSPNSAIVQARFQFITANPMITGNNAAQFTISDITGNAHLYYTLDGSDPSSTNGVDLGTVATPSNAWTVGFPILTNTLFKVRAFRDNYQPSAIVSTSFWPSNYLANAISFGFASGEASSQFIGSPGQTFYAPVTLSVLPSTLMYSLQFNITVTNGGAAPAVTPGAYGFQSMLVKPVVPVPTNYPAGFSLYTPIPPYMFVGNASSPPPTNQIVSYNNGSFINLETINTNLNLLGVGWLERYSETNLYDTLSQDLIQFSIAHDDLFSQSAGSVIVGGYGFQIPANATCGQQYQIQIGRPSATSDGIGAPGSDVFIATPTNGSLAAGAMNSIKMVTVACPTTGPKYLAGDCYPFRWFNAGDFGDTNLNNADVEQVFESAIYGVNTPPSNTDLYDSMDSCGGFGGLDPSTGSYTNAGALSLAQQNALFDGNDTNINAIAFGDGVLDVCDVYVTFRRSLDPSLYWFQRFWANGVRGAQVFPQSNLQAQTGLQPKLSMSFLTNPPSVNFASADFTASAGQTLQVPITAKIFGNYPLRLLMLNLSVEPLDRSPALTSPVQFTPNAALGTPAMSSSTGNGNYAATWLSSTAAGLTGTATLGTLTVTVPANAPRNAAYAIHFAHASASPNGIASFPKKTLTGLILLSDRSSSIYNDGIPDAWRLRYFGTVNNLLSQAAADADGDGASNWQEYIAGTDPTDAKSVLRISTDQGVAQQNQDCVVHWPSVAGKQYIIERSSSLFGPNWIPVSTNTGSGNSIEFHDTTGGSVRFYRVQVTP